MGLLHSPIESLEPEESLHPQMEILLEFRAGKLVWDGTRVHADPRKGLVRVVRTEDSLVHFQCLDVVVDAVEEDQIVLPEEATFEKVSQSSGRVYILKFKHDDRKFFYWMQGPRVDEDQDNCENVKHLLNHPLYADEEEEVNLQLTSAASESREATEAFTRDMNMAGFQDEASQSSVGALQLADLQRILHSLGEVLVPQAPAEEYYRDTGPSFTDIFKPEAVLPLLDIRTLKERLVPFLSPCGVETPEAVGTIDESAAVGQWYSNRELILTVLNTFEQVRQQIIKDPTYGQALLESSQTKNDRTKGNSKRVRADLKAACLMRKNGFWLNERVRPIGDVPGVVSGDCFKYRIEMAVIGLHRAVQAGIAVVPLEFSPYGKSVASSVILGVSDHNQDDKDMGETVEYSGQGGLCNRTKESQDQKLERGNLALCNSYELKLPVRFIRGYKQQNAMTGVLYSYDGLYQVVDMNYLNGVNGKKVFQFLMKRLLGQPPCYLAA